VRHRLLQLLIVAAVAGGLGLGAVSAVGAQQRVGRIHPLQLRVAPVVSKAPVLLPARRPPSRAVGRPDDGRLVNGVMLPDEGRDFVSWDPILHRLPNRRWRRFATPRMLEVIRRALRDYRRTNPGAPQVLIGDLSLPQGGPFGREYGGLGHASHQNGLDVDIPYPRRDGQLDEPRKVGEVHRHRAQELVDAFVAQPEVRFAFVGFDVGVEGPPRVVQQIPLHNDHVHIRIRPR